MIDILPNEAFSGKQRFYCVSNSMDTNKTCHWRSTMPNVFAINCSA